MPRKWGAKFESYISLESVEKICRALNCKVDDIVEFVTDDTEENRNDA